MIFKLRLSIIIMLFLIFLVFLSLYFDVTLISQSNTPSFSLKPRPLKTCQSTRLQQIQTCKRQMLNLESHTIILLLLLPYLSVTDIGRVVC